MVRRQVAQSRMPPFPVIEAFGVLEDSQLRLLPGGQLVAVHHFCFHRLKEAICYRIIPAVFFPAHALPLRQVAPLPAHPEHVKNSVHDNSQ